MFNIVGYSDATLEFVFITKEIIDIKRFKAKPLIKLLILVQKFVDFEQAQNHKFNNCSLCARRET